MVARLEDMFPGRPFTPDGHMVGSIGECLAAARYDLELMPPSNPGYDAVTKDGLQVETKATQGKSVAFRSEPEHTLVLRINRDGSIDEIYNGPGAPVWARFAGKSVPSNGQFQIGLSVAVRVQASAPLRSYLTPRRAFRA